MNILVIAGPTASGKTDLAIEIAKKINGEIISADSMQVYKYMNIGTAKPSKEEMNCIPHYLIDEIYPNEDFSIALFQKMAKNYISKIEKENKIPILVGGTGFYINSIIYDNNFMETNKDVEYRNHLYKLAEENGSEYIFSMLKKIDLESSEKIHPNNIRRVVRALEYHKETGKKISFHNKTEKSRIIKNNGKFIIVNRNRDELYKRINERVDFMIENGLIEEVSNLLKMGYSEKLVSMQGLGYKEIVWYLKGMSTLNETIEILKRDTRRYAKRQLTWFKNQTVGTWVNIAEESEKNNLINEVVNDYKNLKT